MVGGLAAAVSISADRITSAVNDQSYDADRGLTTASELRANFPVVDLPGAYPRCMLRPAAAAAVEMTLPTDYCGRRTDASVTSRYGNCIVANIDGSLQRWTRVVHVGRLRHGSRC